MTQAEFTLSADVTVTERFLLFLMDRLLSRDESTYQAWIKESRALLCELTERERELYDLTDAVAEHFDEPDPDKGLEGWAEYVNQLFAATATA